MFSCHIWYKNKSFIRALSTLCYPDWLTEISSFLSPDWLTEISLFLSSLVLSHYLHFSAPDDIVAQWQVYLHWAAHGGMVALWQVFLSIHCVVVIIVGSVLFDPVSFLVFRCVGCWPGYICDLFCLIYLLFFFADLVWLWCPVSHFSGSEGSQQGMRAASNWRWPGSGARVLVEEQRDPSGSSIVRLHNRTIIDPEESLSRTSCFLYLSWFLFPVSSLSHSAGGLLSSLVGCLAALFQDWWDDWGSF